MDTCEHPSWEPYPTANTTSRVGYVCAACGGLGYRRWTTNGLSPVRAYAKALKERQKVDAAVENMHVRHVDRMKCADELRGEVQSDGW